MLSDVNLDIVRPNDDSPNSCAKLPAPDMLVADLEQFSAIEEDLKE